MECSCSEIVILRRLNFTSVDVKYLSNVKFVFHYPNVESVTGYRGCIFSNSYIRVHPDLK